MLKAKLLNARHNQSEDFINIRGLVFKFVPVLRRRLSFSSIVEIFNDVLRGIAAFVLRVMKTGDIFKVRAIHDEQIWRSIDFVLSTAVID